MTEAQNQTLGQYASAGGLATESLSAVRTIYALNAQADVISKYRVYLFEAMYVSHADFGFLARLCSLSSSLDAGGHPEGSQGWLWQRTALHDILLHLRAGLLVQWQADRRCPRQRLHGRLSQRRHADLSVLYHIHGCNGIGTSRPSIDCLLRC